jgi:CheY-like chemotaxis protein
LIREIIAEQGGMAEVHVDGDLITFRVELPCASQTVLVVDDNMDTAHMYRRYTTGTPYYIVHVSQGRRVMEIIQESQPDIIVLDIMLPDLDGWELLAHLREHPESRSIPILVCSVVRERDLALALGADLYLTKPVQRAQFVQALDQLVSSVLA